jgi:hypothetical protein
MCFDVFPSSSASLSSALAEIVWIREAHAGLHFIIIKSEGLEALRVFL